jgi:hypothetical protein
MKPYVIPILLPNIAWTKFLKDVAEFSGHSPTSNIDNCKIKLPDFSKYVVALDEMRNGVGDALDVLRNENTPLNHLFFSFLVSCSKEAVFNIIEASNLNIVLGNNVAVVSGTLLEWRDATTNYYSEEQARQVINKCLSFFSRIGLGHVWDEYRRKAVDKETFLLEKKCK